MPRRFSFLLLVSAITAACVPPPRPPPQPDPPEWIPTNLLRHISALASDRFEGRAPGTHGEELTLQYLTGELTRAQYTPEVQNVPLVAITSRPTLWYEGSVPLSANEDYVAWSYATSPRVRVDRSDVVFVGYGVVAPELDWDDFKDVDVRGKTLVFLIGDPPVPDPKDPTKLDEATFRGRAMTYYGRWTYKYEIAAKKGAAAALIVHETGPAGYGWNVVAGGGARERYELATAEARDAHVAVEGWMQAEGARTLFRAFGRDFDELKKRALGRDFRPEAVGSARANIEIQSTSREIVSHNIIARLPGSDSRRSDEHVMYSAHWDHFGRGKEGTFHGALDNASGCAWLLETARLFRQQSPAPRRSLLFALFTAEEQGLLGSKYYASHPTFPLKSTVADINMDIMNPWGRTRAIVSIGDGQTTMDETLRDEAARQHRRVVPDPESEKGYYFRSDHFELVKKGVPALSFLFPGADYVNQPDDFGAKKRAEYVARMYHQPNDIIQPDWDLSGAAEDVELLYNVGRRVADTEQRPSFKPPR